MNDFTITCQVNKINSKCTSTIICDKLEEFQYVLKYDDSIGSQIHAAAEMPTIESPCICLHIEHKALGIAGVWSPGSGLRRNLTGDWISASQINLSHSAPVLCFFDYNGQNRLTIALSEVSRDILSIAGIHEETGELYIDLLLSLSSIADSHLLSCRVDCRSLPFHSAVQDISKWWDTLLPDAPMPVPESSRLPMYSTWYSYHQDMTHASLCKEYEQAVKMGMKAVIIDDGWQTTDNNRGYGFCGDWEPAVPKFPDFQAHIKQIHALGMKCLLWYSVPFIGEYSSIWPRFKDMLLGFNTTLHAGILDPRYAQVREYLISTYEKAVTDWDLDGLKLDFIDSFRQYPDSPAYQEGMDFQEIQDAVYCLMIGIFRRLKDIKPDLLIEFRQTYIGPQMRRFGNILRVSDCPLSGITNRVGIADLKLTSGTTAVHSDMLMWHTDETPENVAIQLINCIFSVLQISVKLDTLSVPQRKVLEHYLDFSIRHRDILQEGDFTPENPLMLYPVIRSQKDHTCITAVYDSERIATLPQDGCLSEYWILNGYPGSSLSLSFQEEGCYDVSVFDCMGTRVTQSTQTFSGICRVPVPAGGSILLQKQGS